MKGVVDFADPDYVRVARLNQNRSMLAEAPNSVVKIVLSTSTICPARAPAGGIQRNVLNSSLPEAVKGCGLDMSIGCLASTRIDFAVRSGDFVMRQVLVEIECCHSSEPSGKIEIPHGGQRRKLVCVR